MYIGNVDLKAQLYFSVYDLEFGVRILLHASLDPFNLNPAKEGRVYSRGISLVYENNIEHVLRKS